jgi:hypothetical protein
MKARGMGCISTEKIAYCDTGKSSLTISAKPVGVGVVLQPWISTGERSGSLTHIAMTGTYCCAGGRKIDGVSGIGIGD